MNGHHKLNAAPIQALGLVVNESLPQTRQMAIAIEQWAQSQSLSLQHIPLPSINESEQAHTEHLMTAFPQTLGVVILVLGGDGTMIHACRCYGGYGIPLLGINHGRLGFLTDVADGQLMSALTALQNGHYHGESRRMLCAQVRSDTQNEKTLMAVNDIYVNKSESESVLALDINVDGDFMNTLRADGLIVSTPTGSTAYALSAGGPIVHPQAQGLLMVAVAPHSLTNRPIVLPANVTINLAMPKGRKGWLFADGHHRVALDEGAQVRIHYADQTYTLAHPDGYDFYRNLRDKLYWNEMPTKR